jgi:hypothetical protein
MAVSMVKKSQATVNVPDIRPGCFRLVIVVVPAVAVALRAR